MDVEQYQRSGAGEVPLFFDRGIPDALGMLHQIGGLSGVEEARYRSEYPYSSNVLLLPPWKEIYRTDDERDQTFEESIRVCEGLRQWYGRLGYNLVEVPPGPVDERCAFALRVLALQRRPTQGR